MHITGFSMGNYHFSQAFAPADFLSAGGYGTWDLGLFTPERFASIMHVCGGGHPIRAQNSKHVLQWVHHGEQDDIIPISASQKIVDAWTKAQSDEVKFSRYPDAAHDS